MPTPRTRERLWLLVAIAALLAAVLVTGLDAWRGLVGPLIAAASVAGVRYGTLSGRRTATDADVEAAAYARVQAALRNVGLWRAWRKCTTRGGRVDAAELAAVAAYLQHALTTREDQA